MKIQSILGLTTGYSSLIKEQQDGGSERQNNSGYQKNSGSEQKPPHDPAGQNLGSSPEEQPKERPEPTPEQVEVAIEAFKADPKTQAKGLSANLENTPKGLKVVLTGPMGSVIKRFTGGEFLDLRDSIKSAAGSSGVLLDRKF